METTLNRPTLDKLSSGFMLLFSLILCYFTFNSLDVIWNMILIGIVLVSFTNAVFINTTPIAKLNGNTLKIFAEDQPIILKVKPQIFSVSKLIDIEVDRQFFTFRIIFKLPHGTNIYHSFPATREKRVKMLLEFLSKNTNSEIVRTAYNKSFNTDAGDAGTG